MAMADSDSDSDVVLHQDIPFNSNHHIMLTFESQLDSTNNYVRHPHRTKHGGQSRGPAVKHHNHSRAGTNPTYCDDTNDYFELARQARLLSNGDAVPGTSVNDHGKNVVPDMKNGVGDRGKGVIDTGESFRLKGSRFQLNKPLRNRKGKQAVGNHGGEGSSAFNGFSGQRKLVLNGCISPDNVSQFRQMSRHNAGCSGHFSGQEVDVHDKGKGKLGLSDCSEAQKSGGGVIMHERRETSACNEKQHGLNLRRNYCTGKRKYRKDKPNLGESSLILGSSTNHSQKITIIDISDEEERERDACSEEYWSLEESRLNNEVLADQSAIISQVESDEMLARRLQDQFNQEARNFEVLDEEDDDAIIARALQEEDDAFDVDGHNIMPFRRSRREVNDRNQSMEHLYSQSHRFQSRRLPMQIPNRRRTQTRFNNADMDYEMLLISQLRRGLGSSNMDIDTRLSILEALEEVFENQSDVDISGHVYHNDPNSVTNVMCCPSNDPCTSTHHWEGTVENCSCLVSDESYEALSTLDEDNHQHSGVTDGQINILPVSTIKGDKMEDTCVICLEDPAAGDVMRHLPCLHKFHKECIDPWLRRKNACPVCKSSIA